MDGVGTRAVTNAKRAQGVLTIKTKTELYDMLSKEDPKLKLTTRTDTIKYLKANSITDTDNPDAQDIVKMILNITQLPTTLIKGALFATAKIIDLTYGNQLLNTERVLQDQADNIIKITEPANKSVERNINNMSALAERMRNSLKKEMTK